MSWSRAHLTAVACVLLAATACAPGTDGEVGPDEAATPAEPDPAGRAERETTAATEPVEDEGEAGALLPAETSLGPAAPVVGPPHRSDDYPRWGDEPSRLVDTRLGALDGRDRLVLEFAGSVPSFEVREVSPPIREQPGGGEVELPGERHLELRLVPATTLDRGAEEPAAAYRGPTHLDAEPPGLLEAALTGDHRDLVVVSLGLAGEAEVAVEVLEAPARIVLDVLRSPS